jgi:signal transduction histidine kinase
MFSPELYPRGQDQFAPEQAVEMTWEEIGSCHTIQAGLVVRVDLVNNALKVVSSHHIPKEPFNGSEREPLVKLIEDCFQKFPKAHVHSSGHLQLTAILSRFSQRVSNVTRTVFIPTTAYGVQYIFLGFLSANHPGQQITPELLGKLDRLLCFLTAITANAENVERLRITELFVKEVGHDIASSVQAIIAKVRTIRDGRFPDNESLKRKAGEIEREINNTYGIADMLGLAIDTNYQLRSFADFDVTKIVASAIEQLLAEADERNIKFKVATNNDVRVQLWGDERAIQLCFTHLFLNAVKYSFGGTFIEVGIVNRTDSVSIHVTNKGHQLPKGDEAIEIWDFGVRGKKAKELHVNGSGIGLYTVKKIIVAHRGRAWAEGHGDMTTFSVCIPKREKMREALGLV